MPYSDPAKHRESVRKSHARNPEIKRRYKLDNLHKTRTHTAVWRALSDGRLEREACLFCDDPDVVAHHHDYAQPLSVTWLCERHHKRVHALDARIRRAELRATKPKVERICPTCGTTLTVPADSKQRYCTKNCAQRASYYRVGQNRDRAKRAARRREIRNTVIHRDTPVIPPGTIVFSTAPHWPSGGKPLLRPIYLTNLRTVQRSSHQIAWAGGGGYWRWVNIPSDAPEFEKTPAVESDDEVPFE